MNDASHNAFGRIQNMQFVAQNARYAKALIGKIKNRAVEQVGLRIDQIIAMRKVFEPIHVFRLELLKHGSPMFAEIDFTKN